jgi:hypothetical protein
VVLLARGSAMPTKTRPRDGSRRLAQPLQAEGFLVGRDNARRLRPAAGVVVRHRQRGPGTTDRRQGDAVAPKLLARPCEVEPSDPVWAGDLPSLGTAAGGFDWAAGLDWPSRTGVGWAMRRRLEAALVREAWGLARGATRSRTGMNASRGSWPSVRLGRFPRALSGPEQSLSDEPPR